MSRFRTRIDGQTGRRRSPRRPVCVAGSALTINGSNSVVVADVCRDGAKLVGRHLPSVGKQVLIWTEDVNVLGSIVWSQFGEHGLVFDTPLDASVLRTLENHVG